MSGGSVRVRPVRRSSCIDSSSREADEIEIEEAGGVGLDRLDDVGPLLLFPIDDHGAGAQTVYAPDLLAKVLWARGL